MDNKLKILVLVLFGHFGTQAQKSFEKSNIYEDDNLSKKEFRITTSESSFTASLKGVLIKPLNENNETEKVEIDLNGSIDNVALILDRFFNTCVKGGCLNKQVVKVYGLDQNSNLIVPTYYFNESPFMTTRDNRIEINKASDNDVVCFFTEPINRIFIENGKSIDSEDFLPFIKLGDLIRFPLSNNQKEWPAYCNIDQVKIFLDESLSMNKIDRSRAISSVQYLLGILSNKKDLFIEIIAFGDKKKVIYTGALKGLKGSEKVSHLFTDYQEAFLPTRKTDWTPISKETIDSEKSLNFIFTDAPFNSFKQKRVSTHQSIAELAQADELIIVDVNTERKVFGAINHLEIKNVFEKYKDSDCFEPEDNSEINIKIYPNPTDQFLNFSNLNDQVHHFRIHSMDGVQHMNLKISNTIDISALSAGTYTIDFIDEKEQIIERHPFVKI